MRDAPPISISPQESRALDEAIDNQIKTANDALVQHYLTLAENLHSMHVGRGYEALGFRSWTAYLDKKNTFGRSYLTYLLKLAQAGKHNLEPLMRPGMSATKLITYAKATDFPDKIPQLIRATWSQVAPLSVREAERVVKAYVASHAEAYRKAG
ncbi:MAG: hypothetical protein H7338_17910, partial [Candidatus Sericytochromatia bacterium]|nr:hypothetical protein [Candidatus Sericytochromatia bacterium]